MKTKKQQTMDFYSILKFLPELLLFYFIYNVTKNILLGGNSIKKNFFRKKKVLIIGGTNGLGLSLASQLKEKGAKVTITGRSKKDLKKLKNIFSFKVKKVDVTVNYCPKKTCCGNVGSNDSSKQNICLGYLPFHGSFDIVFYCAGYCSAGYFKDKSVDDYKNEMDVNYIGAIKCLKHFYSLRNNEEYAQWSASKHEYKRSASRKSKGIAENAKKTVKETQSKPLTFVLIGSTLSVTPIPGYSAYAPTKAALKSLFDNLHLELIKENIFLKIFIATNMKTKGYMDENRKKPDFTKKIDSYGYIMCPEDAAKVLLDNIVSFPAFGHNIMSYYLGKYGNSIIVSDFFSEMLLIKSDFNGLKQFLLAPFATAFYWIWKMFLTKKFLNESI